MSHVGSALDEPFGIPSKLLESPKTDVAARMTMSGLARSPARDAVVEARGVAVDAGDGDGAVSGCNPD